MSRHADLILGHVIQLDIDGFGYIAESQNPEKTYVFSMPQVIGESLNLSGDIPVLFHLGQDGKIDRVLPLDRELLLLDAALRADSILTTTPELIKS